MDGFTGMHIEPALVLAAICAWAVGGLVFQLLYRRWYLPRQSRLKLDRLRREEEAGIPPSPRDYRHAIAFDSAGFTVTDLRSKDQERTGMCWDEVCQATAFKRDLFSTDCICLFLARTDGTGVELNEEMARWNTLVQALPQHLAGCKPWSEWFSAVAFPAFVPNATEIYRRGS
jgi:hypothetical protein